MLNDDVLFLIKNDYEKQLYKPTFNDWKKKQLPKFYDFLNHHLKYTLTSTLDENPNTKNIKFYKNGKPRVKNFLSTIIKDTIEIFIDTDSSINIDELMIGNLTSNRSDMYIECMKIVKKYKIHIIHHYEQLCKKRDKCSCCGSANNIFIYDEITEKTCCKNCSIIIGKIPPPLFEMMDMYECKYHINIDDNGVVSIPSKQLIYIQDLLPISCNEGEFTLEDMFENKTSIDEKYIDELRELLEIMREHNTSIIKEVINKYTWEDIQVYFNWISRSWEMNGFNTSYKKFKTKKHFINYINSWY